METKIIITIQLITFVFCVVWSIATYEALKGFKRQLELQDDKFNNIRRHVDFLEGLVFGFRTELHQIKEDKKYNKYYNTRMLMERDED